MQSCYLRSNITSTRNGLKHDLEPLDVSCFKPFKTTFRKVKDVAMSRNNRMEPDKITLDGWVDKVLEQSVQKNIKFGFMAFQSQGNG
jgi:hypothetical protein